MFFTEYKPMTTEEVTSKIIAKPKADGASSEALAGKSFKARLEGEFAPQQLDYEFLDGQTLAFTQDGNRFEVPYAAIELGRAVLFTHLVPQTDKGWHIVLDTKTCELVAFETWTGITVPVGIDLYGQKEPDGYRDIPREVQRHYYFGWADFGDNQKPQELPTYTNRLEGRGLHWDFSTGYEILTFFPSIVCSTVVELGDKMGGITVTGSSDYIRFDDEYYVYTRGMAEFGGDLWIEILNFFDCTAAGMQFGFDENDQLIYELHTAKLDITGDIAHLEGISCYGDQGKPMPQFEGKGARYTYRPMDIDVPMSHEEALKHAEEAQTIFEVNDMSIMASKNCLPKTDALVGKKFKIVLDCEKHASSPWAGDKSIVYEYDVISEDKLLWRINDGEWQEDTYLCMEPAKDLYFFAHVLTGEPDYANVSQVADFSTGLTTTVRAQIGNWHSEWEMGSCVKFGTLQYGDIKPPFARRHHFSRDMVGKSFAWSYSEMMSSIHVYSSPESYSWTIFQEDNSGGASWSSPCYYIKLRDDAYLFQWVEEKCNGLQGLVIFNPEIMHDGGFSYGVSHMGLNLSTMGAYARELGSFDIKKYFI